MSSGEVRACAGGIGGMPEPNRWRTRRFKRGDDTIASSSYSAHINGLLYHGWKERLVPSCQELPGEAFFNGRGGVFQYNFLSNLRKCWRKDCRRRAEAADCRVSRSASMIASSLRSSDLRRSSLSYSRTPIAIYDYIQRRYLYLSAENTF